MQFSLPDLLPATWTIKGVSNEILGVEFTRDSPTYIPLPNGYEISLDFKLNKSISAGTLAGCVTTDCSAEANLAGRDLVDNYPYTTIAPDVVPESATLAYSALALLVRGLHERKEGLHN